jgi:hypothetical protein
MGALVDEPASAGIMSGGGSYSGFTERRPPGSRPNAHHTTPPQITASIGNPSGQ